jgi:hypothetical protein
MMQICPNNIHITSIQGARQTAIPAGYCTRCCYLCQTLQSAGGTSPAGSTAFAGVLPIGYWKPHLWYSTVLDVTAGKDIWAADSTDQQLNECGMDLQPGQGMYAYALQAPDSAAIHGRRCSDGQFSPAQCELKAATEHDNDTLQLTIELMWPLFLTTLVYCCSMLQGCVIR